MAPYHQDVGMPMCKQSKWNKGRIDGQLIRTNGQFIDFKVLNITPYFTYGHQSSQKISKALSGRFVDV